MAFDFDHLVTRRGSNSYKWDSAEDDEMLPMWVADMDFQTAPSIIDALAKRVAHGIFGYSKVPPRYYQAVTHWFATRHGFRFAADEMLYTIGVVPALSAIMQALVKPGQGIIVATPAYNCFFSSIRNSECVQVSSPLINENGHFRLDLDDIAEKAADDNNVMFLLCNPHNPVGRAWHEDELRALGKICFANHLIVLSDEIHCDLMLPGSRHIPFASLGEEYLQRSITCTSPSKSFNLAGLQGANILAANVDWRARIDKQININEVCDISPFAITGMIAAYETGAPWLDELLAYLAGNVALVKEFLARELPQIKLTPIEATYLLWLDCRETGMTSHELAQKCYQEQHLWLSEGEIYGAEGAGFLRMNIATSRANVKEGLARLRRALN